MKRTAVFLIPLIAGLLFTTCLHQDMVEGNVAGHIELDVTFEDYMAGENATMIMAYVWEGATWEAAAAPDSLGLPTVGEVQNKMFGINTTAEIHGEYSVTFNLPEGKYYVSVFETFNMNYTSGDTALQLVGYYNANVDTTYNSDTEPSPLNLSEANDEYDIMLVAISKDCAGVPGGNAVLDCAGVCNGTANLDVCGLCVEPGNECEAIVSGAIQLTVDFNDYETQSDAAMIMAYLWTGTTWDTATLIEGSSGWAMFPLAPPGTFDGPTTVTFQEVAEGTYFVGVFETTGMAYDSPLATVGYYNQTVAEEFNSPDTPTGLTTNEITMHAGH
ncbi:MAG TPA: hypothetical protein EYM89_07205 [Candidatus Marinimicrobia bacterium]|nr:hypothetical protein [Candidatus Neomarinimicrobiota bacterium]